MARVHPSSRLRAPDEESRELELKHFVADLTVAANLLRESPKGIDVPAGEAGMERRD
jgi:hypothetical protein